MGHDDFASADIVRPIWRKGGDGKRLTYPTSFSRISDLLLRAFCGGAARRKNSILSWGL
jgi:hypothetical protein